MKISALEMGRFGQLPLKRISVGTLVAIEGENDVAEGNNGTESESMDGCAAINSPEKRRTARRNIGGYILVSKNYNIEHDDEYIKIMLKNWTGTNYFTKNDMFLEVLDKWHITMSYNKKSGRLMADLWRGPWRTRERIYLYDLALASYLEIIHADTLTDDLQKYFKWKKSQRLTVDHLDSNIINNTAENLALMSLIANNQKRSFPAVFAGPYALTVAYVDGEYRVQLAMGITALDDLQRVLDCKVPGVFRLSGAGMSTLRFICPDENSLVACLKRLYDSKFSWCNPGESARDYRNAHKDSIHMAADVRRSISAQRTLAQMDRSQFQIFNSGENYSKSIV